ncbi:MFS transporter [Escherichia coli]|nr:MFS transporter [Escherichia coli]
MSRFLICSFALVLLYPAGIDMYLVGLPRIAADLNASEAQLHIAFSVYLAGMAAAMLFAGKVADRSGRKPVAIPGAALFIIASVFCSQAETSTLFLAGRFLQGLGAGCCYVVAFAILRDTLDDRRRAKVLSLLNGITCIIPVLAPVLGHLIMLKFPWQSLFWTMAIMGIAVLMFMLYGIGELPEIVTLPKGKPVFSDKNLPSFSISYAGNMVGVALTTEGECGLDMELQRATRGFHSPHAPDNHTFSSNESLWISKQNDPNEARAQLITLRRSVLKLTGDVLNDDPRDLQLLPIAGRLKCAHVNHVEALCDAEDVLVWSVAVTPTIEKLSVWELDGKHGWKSLPDIHSRANNPTSRMMRFAQLSTMKAFSPN